MGEQRFDPDPQALAILRKLREAGFEAYFCGGCVRDSLMGRQPEDWDIATGATPEQIEAIFPKTLAVGRSFGVVIVMTTRGKLQWGNILGGLVPDLSMLSRPADTFADALKATGEFASYWEKTIVGMQRGVMISAAATAVGINMTFLLPYSMLAKGWRKNARGLAIFDLSTGLFIPFILATGVEYMVLGEETISGMYRLHAGLLRGVEYIVDVEVTL